MNQILNPNNTKSKSKISIISSPKITNPNINNNLVNNNINNIITINSKIIKKDKNINHDIVNIPSKNRNVIKKANAKKHVASKLYIDPNLTQVFYLEISNELYSDDENTNNIQGKTIKTINTLSRGISFFNNTHLKPYIRSYSLLRKSEKLASLFKILFVISVIISTFFIGFYGYTIYDMNKNEALSKQLVEDFNASRLYLESENSQAQEVVIEEPDFYTVIGLIEIDRINISYPILSEINDELLKYAPCKFYGPMPNEIGNICIAAHNYNSYKFFSNLKKLSNGDMIEITDLKGNIVEYSVYDKREVNQDDLTIISQDTNNLREVTLVTCNNITGKRYIVKAKEI